MDKDKVKELSEKFGTYDLLTAYIMRELSCDYETADDITYRIADELDRWIHGVNEEEF